MSHISYKLFFLAKIWNDTPMKPFKKNTWSWPQGATVTAAGTETLVSRWGNLIAVGRSLVHQKPQGRVDQKPQICAFLILGNLPNIEAWFKFGKDELTRHVGDFWSQTGLMVTSGRASVCFGWDCILLTYRKTSFRLYLPQHAVSL